MNAESLELSWRLVMAVLAGGVANFMLGALWYMALFQKPWLAATGRSKEDFGEDGPGPAMLLTLLGALVSTWVIALVFHWSGGSSAWDGLLIGLLLGVGVAFWERLKTAVYNFDEKVHAWKLFAVDAGYAVSGMALAGLIFGLII